MPSPLFSMFTIMERCWWGEGEGTVNSVAKMVAGEEDADEGVKEGKGKAKERVDDVESHRSFAECLESLMGRLTAET